jgi:hypothetical protein
LVSFKVFSLFILTMNLNINSLYLAIIMRNKKLLFEVDILIRLVTLLSSNCLCRKIEHLYVLLNTH